MPVLTRAEVEWRERSADAELAGRIAVEHSVSPAMGRLLASRGVAAEDAAAFLSPALKYISDPLSIAGMDKAASRLVEAVVRRQRILVYGDYDCDGLTAAAVVYRFLKGAGHNDVDVFIPDRLDDGYGLIRECLERCIVERRPDLIVTVDCGVNATDEVEYVKANGIDIIVTDHHEPASCVAAPSALVNPKLGGSSVLKDLAGVGVAFMLVYAAVKTGRANGWDCPFDIRELLGLVALGTVADIVPLTKDNRIIVRAGIERLKTAPGHGLGALMKVCGIDQHEISAYHFGYLLGPRINAAGRLGNAGLGLRLLVAEDEDEAMDAAKQLDDGNRQRRLIEDGILGEAVELVESSRVIGQGIVVYRKGWHPGTLGIVASRLAARYNRPAAVIAVDDKGEGRGSCRSVDGVNLTEVLQECGELLTAFGGHVMAAGLSIKADKIPAFVEQFAECCGRRCGENGFAKVIEFDGWIEPKDVTLGLCREMFALQPAGAGNPEPVWGLSAVDYSSVRIFKDRHLSFMVAGNGAKLKVIGFGMAARQAELPTGKIDMLFELKCSTFNGREGLDLVLKDFRPSPLIARVHSAEAPGPCGVSL